MKESDLIKAISNYLKTVPNLFFWKEHGGMYGTAGIPDLIICYKGRFIGLECKVGKNTATALQTANDSANIESGRICGSRKKRRRGKSDNSSV